MNVRVGRCKVHYGRLCARYCNTDEAKRPQFQTRAVTRNTRTKHDDAAAAPKRNYETYPSPPITHFAFAFSNALFCASHCFFSFLNCDFGKGSPLSFCVGTPSASNAL